MTAKYINIGLRIALVLMITLSVVSPVKKAWAAESTSFRLYTGHPNDADGGPKQSGSFKLNEGKMTWRKLPLASTSFQLVTAPPATSAESGSSSSSGGGSSSSGSGGGGGGGGGRRGSPPIPPETEPPVDDPIHPAAPDEPAPEPEPVRVLPPIFTGQVQVDLPVSAPEVQEGVSYPPGERLIDRVHFFNLVDSIKPAVQRHMTWPNAYRRFGFTSRDYALFVLNASILSIFFYFLLSLRRGVVLQYAPAFRLRRGSFHLPFFALLHKKARSVFIIRDLYPKYVKKKQFKNIPRS
jgi:hypothetical protein